MYELFLLLISPTFGMMEKWNLPHGGDFPGFHHSTIPSVK
jgi:hypothetical protein